MAEPKTIYLEADEEVTSVIDKLRKTEFTEVVLVVPKEASLLQSVVNLKLIKKQAADLGKSVSLITQDKVGRNLAEKVGLATASKVGQEPKLAEEKAEPVQDKKESTGPIEDTNEIVFKKANNESNIPEDELVVSEDEDTEAEAAWHKKEVEEKQPKNLMPKFPKKKLFLIGIPIVLILLLVGFVFLPQAKAIVSVSAEKRSVSLDFSGEKGASLDVEKNIISAKVLEATKESSKKYSATGKKNVGTKATGTVKIINTSAANTLTWSAGTRLYPSGNPSLIFKTTAAVNITPAQTSKTVSVEAVEASSQYNGFDNTAFYSVTLGSQPTVYTATSIGGMSGGVSKEITYVTQADINSAKADLEKSTGEDALTDFNKQAENLKVVDDSKKQETLSAGANPSVNSETNEFTMTVKVSVKALAFSMDDVNSLIKAEVEKQLGSTKQIIDNGSGEATIDINTNDLTNGKFTASVETNAYVANKLDQNKIKTELTGSSATKAENYLKGLEGVENVKLEFWPSFIKIFPRLKNHIYITVEVANNSTN